jgi:hypothetical protein
VHGCVLKFITVQSQAETMCLLRAQYLSVPVHMLKKNSAKVRWSSPSLTRMHVSLLHRCSSHVTRLPVLGLGTMRTSVHYRSKTSLMHLWYSRASSLIITTHRVTRRHHCMHACSLARVCSQKPHLLQGHIRPSPSRTFSFGEKSTRALSTWSPAAI